jgi:hypothetical protein
VGKPAKKRRNLISWDARATNARSSKSIAKREFSLLRRSMRSLSRSFRRTALDQLSRIATAVAEDPTLETNDKVAALYEAIDRIVCTIDEISKHKPIPDNVPSWRTWDNEVKEKIHKREPLNELEQSRNPFLFAARFYGDGCPMAVIGRRDPQLKKSLYDWERQHGNKTGIHFPAEREVNDTILTAIGINPDLYEEPDLERIPASKLLQARPILTIKTFLKSRKIRAASEAKRSLG